MVSGHIGPPLAETKLPFTQDIVQVNYPSNGTVVVHNGQDGDLMRLHQV